MKSKSFIITGAVVAAIALCGPMTAFGASKKAAASPSPSPAASASASMKTAASPSEKMPRSIPFRGTVSAVDQSAKTFTIQGKENARVFKMTDKTTVTKADAAATPADIVVDTKVTGSYWKQADGSRECRSVKIHVAGEEMKETAKPAKRKKSEAKAATSASPAASPAASPKK